MSKKDIKIAAKQTGETAQKISGDMIQVGNIEINTNGYQAGSALETMLGRAQKFKAQQVQNDNTPNGDNGGGGDNTPSSSPTGTVIETPPQGENAAPENVVSKETANGDVSNVTPLTFAEVAKAKQLSPERLEEIIDAAENDNLFPTEKLNSQDLIDRVNILTGLYSIKSLQNFAEEMNLCSSHSKTNKPLGRETIYAMLKNPFYYGEMVIRGEKMPHASEPLISKSLYDKVQEVRSGGKIHTKMREYAGIPFVFRGLVKCAECGGTITSEQHFKKSGRKYTYLRCTHSNGCCHQGLVSENLLLQQLDDEVFSKIRLSCNILEPLKKCVQKKLIEESDANMVMKRKITMELNNLEAKERRVKDSFFDGDISREEWQEEKALIATKREELQRTAEKYADISKEILLTVNETLDIAANVSDIMKKADPIQQNKLLSLMLAECYLDGQKLIYKLQKPFDKLVNLKSVNTWFDFDKSDIKEYETMAEKLQMYKVERERLDICS